MWTACLGKAQFVETQICKKRKTAPGVAQRLEGAGSERGDERRNSAHTSLFLPWRPPSSAEFLTSALTMLQFLSYLKTNTQTTP